MGASTEPKSESAPSASGSAIVNTAKLESVGKLGPNPRGLVLACDLAFFGDARLAEHENLLHRHHLAFHTDDFADADDTAGTIGHAGDMNDHIQRGADLLSHRQAWKLHAAE